MDFHLLVYNNWVRAPKIDLYLGNGNCFRDGYSRKVVAPLGVLVICPIEKKLWFQNKKLTFGTKYQNLPQNSHFGPKICIFGDLRANWLWPVGCFYNRASTYFITNYLKQCSTFLDTLAFGKCGKASLRIAAILSVFLRPAGSSNTNLNTKINF